MDEEWKVRLYDDGFSDHLNPIYGLEKIPVTDLDASLSQHGNYATLKMGIRAALKFADKLLKRRDDIPLSQQQVAAIHLYTQASPFYKDLNTSLRSEVREWTSGITLRSATNLRFFYCLASS